MLFPVLIVLTFLAGIVLVMRGFTEVREEATHSVTARLTQRRQRASEQYSENLSENERESPRHEEARAAAKRTTTLPNITQILSGSTLLNSLDEDLFQARSTMRAS